MPSGSPDAVLTYPDRKDRCGMVPCRPHQHAAREMTSPVERFLTDETPWRPMSRLGPHRLSDFGHSGKISQLRAAWLLIFCCLEQGSGLPDIDQSYGDTTNAFRNGFRQSFIPVLEPRHSSVPRTRTPTYEAKP